jgi:hypothetical protein
MESRPEVELQLNMNPDSMRESELSIRTLAL